MLKQILHKSLILFLILSIQWYPIEVYAQNSNFSNGHFSTDISQDQFYPNSFPKALEYTLVGTGKTTGVIMNMVVSNSTDQSLTLPDLKIIFPRVNDNQSYIGHFPEDITTETLTIESGEIDTIAIIGECLDLRKYPLPDGGLGPEVSTLITPTSTGTLPGPGDPLPDGFTSIDPEDNDLIIVNPSTGDPFLYKVDFGKAIEPVSSLIFEIDYKLENTFEDLFDEGAFEELPLPDSRIITEFPQLCKWYTYAILQGEPYTIEEFSERLDSQLITQTGIQIEELPEETQTDWKQGKKSIFEMVTFVGKESKVVIENELNEPASGSPTCYFTCPINNSWINRKNITIEWQCKKELDGPFTMQIESETGEMIQIEEIENNYFTLEQDLSQEIAYSFRLDHPGMEHEGGVPVGGPVLLDLITNPDSMATIGEMRRQLAELWEAVGDASDDLENNPLVEEVRTIEMIRDLLGNPAGVTGMFDEWIGEEFPIPELSDVEDINDLISYINQNISNIRKTLSYAKKLLEYVSGQNGESAARVIAKIERALDSLEALDDFESAYNELHDAIGDIRGYIGDKVEEFISNKIQDTLQRLLTERIGAQAAGSAMSAAMNAMNFIDALIQAGRLEEAKKLYFLLYFDMLDLANSKQRYHIDTTWNGETHGLPQIEWASCAQLIGQRVEIEAFVKCWVRDPGGAPNEGHWEERQINFKGGIRSLVKEPFSSDCDDICAFQFQLDIDDLEENSDGCEHVYVEIGVKVNGVDWHPPRIFSGVYHP
jgi:hypothetical protein